MLDLRFIREEQSTVKKDLKRRGRDTNIVDQILKLDTRRIKTQQKLDKLRHKRNTLSAEINKAQKQDQPIVQLIKEAKKLPLTIKDLEQKHSELNHQIRTLQFQIPNILHKNVPAGKDDTNNKSIRTWGKKPSMTFDQKPHGQFLEEAGLADFSRGSKVAGAGFYYLKGDLALLDLALQRFAIDHLIKKGFQFITPPYLLNKKSYEGVTDLKDFEDVMYKIDNEDLYLIATSEHPLGAMHSNETIDVTEPIKLVGLSPCFRKEIGSHGIDTKGLFRVHQFSKVEQFIFCDPDESWKIHEELQRNSEELFEQLKIPYRVVNVCTGDMGSIASKKYDIEAWFPRTKTYGEVTSCSNCTSYQAVRLNIKYQKQDGTKAYVHTLNNTGLATARVLRAITEHFQTKEGTIKVPKVLWPYMNNIKTIGGNQK